jgi:hypothetical protein
MLAGGIAGIGTGPPAAGGGSGGPVVPARCLYAGMPEGGGDSDATYAVVPVTIKRCADAGAAGPGSSSGSAALTLATASGAPVQKRYSDFLRLYKALEPELRAIARAQPALPKAPPSPKPTAPPNASACGGGCGFSLDVPMLAHQRWECPRGCHRGVETDLNVVFPPKEAPSPFDSADKKAAKKERRRAGLEAFLLAALAGCNGGWCSAAAAQGDRLCNGLNEGTAGAGLCASSRTLVTDFLGCSI